ncbi:MAG: PDZ domain-containing protein, partial [Christensenellaceae bacterium]|nr:PDZ domain-containing protein [Christensenellaceae bacterium]
MPHVIQGVEPGSIADQLGIAPGDVLHTINDRHPVDLIDYQAFCCEEKLSLVVERAGERRVFRFLKDEYEPLGLTFGQALMSRQRDCANECLFCFVDQLPPGARDTLRVKDDDWRMSLMMGNFVTLTNVSDAELTRIIARR